MPTGLNNSPQLPTAPLSQTQPRKAINHTVTLILKSTGVPQKFPGLVVEFGLSVALRGHNGTTGNAAAVRVATYPEALSGSNGRVITPDTEIGFAVDHLGQVWAVGTAGDGLIATVSGVPIG
jgi:hypothetical protein